MAHFDSRGSKARSLSRQKLIKAGVISSCTAQAMQDRRKIKSGKGTIVQMEKSESGGYCQPGLGYMILM